MQTPVTTSYLILSTARSGTNLLCRGLESTNLAGRPREYLSPRGKFWLQYGARADPGAFVDQLLRKRASPNGIFGAKVFWRHLIHFERACRAVPRYQDTPLAEILSDLFPKLHYLRIVRRDKLRQAVSYWKAAQTGVWGLSPGKEQAAAREPAFDYDGITKALRRLLDEEARIDAFCARSGLTPLILVYEEFVDAYDETLRTILRYLGIEVPPDLVIDTPRTVRQADDATDAWIDQYHRIQRERGEALP